MPSGIQTTGNIIHSPPDVLLDLEKGIGEYMLEAFLKYENNISQIDSETGVQETYKQLLKRVFSLAQALQTKGIKPDDVIAYSCSNNKEYVVIILASIFMGVKFSAFDNMSDPREIAHCIKLANPKIIFCAEPDEKVIESAINLAGVSCDIIVFTKSEKYESMPDFIQKYKTQEEFKINTSAKLKDTSCILFTSGTTDFGKGTQVTGYGLYYGALAANRNAPGVSSFMILGVTSWISNISTVMYTLFCGITRVVYKDFNKDNFIKTLYKYKVNGTFLTQGMINILKKFPECCNYDMSYLKYLTIAGSMFGENTLTDIATIFPNAILVNCYGLTEIGGKLFICPKDKHCIDANGKMTVGLPNPGIFYKIVDISTEKCLGPNMNEELRFKYEGIMNGYINNPEKTVEAFDKQGYFKTGDLAYYDENHMFYLIDRLKDIFSYCGRHVSPTIIEDRLLQHSAVKDVAIVPVPDDDGEIPVACIVLREGSTAKEEDFVHFVSEHLPKLYHLRGGVKFVDRIPRTPTGKLRRNVLKEQVTKSYK